MRSPPTSTLFIDQMYAVLREGFTALAYITKSCLLAMDQDSLQWLLGREAASAILVVPYHEIHKWANRTRLATNTASIAFSHPSIAFSSLLDLSNFTVFLYSEGSSTGRVSDGASVGTTAASPGALSLSSCCSSRQKGLVKM